MATTLRSAKKVSATQTKKIVSIPNVCKSCHSLPAGSTDLLSLMLVLVFSLTAVLFTSIYALNVQKAKVAALEQAVVRLTLE